MHRAECLEHLVAIEECIYRGPDFFSREEVSELRAHIDACSVHFSFLERLALRRGVKAYHLTIKSHMLWHMGRDAEYMNPKLMGCCLADEDFVGRIAGMVKGLMKGRNALALPAAIMQQYARGLAVRWSRVQI